MFEQPYFPHRSTQYQYAPLLARSIIFQMFFEKEKYLYCTGNNMKAFIEKLTQGGGSQQRKNSKGTPKNEGRTMDI